MTGFCRKQRKSRKKQRTKSNLSMKKSLKAQSLRAKNPRMNITFRVHAG